MISENRSDRLRRPLLIAADVRNLIVIGHRLKISGVIDVGGIRIKADIAFRGADGVVVTAGLILAEGRHQQSFSLPLRIGILLLEGLKGFRGRGVIPDLQAGEALIVKVVRRRLRDDLGLVFVAAEPVHGVQRIEHVRTGDGRKR